MLKEAMLALRVTDMEYAPDIKRLLIAGKRDLEIAGVQITGEIAITITDDLVITAIITYAGARGNYAGADERAKLDASYDLQRRQLANATGYTDFLEPEPTPEEPAEEELAEEQTAEDAEAGADA